MQIGSILAVFFVVWWISFVAVLPIGQRSQAELGEIVAGTDPGAPGQLRLGHKALVATGLAIILTLLLFWGLSNELLRAYWSR